jgi:hypothetical protein
MEEYRKSLKSIVMRQVISAGLATTNAAAETLAYSDPSYLQHLTALKEAGEKAEALRWGLVAAQARIDVWRSLEASNRVMDKVTL